VTTRTAKTSPKDLPLLPETVEAYSIAETAQRHGLSVQRVRKLVASGKLEGLGHRPSPTGLGYAIPVEAMTQAGYGLGETKGAEAETLKALLEEAVVQRQKAEETLETSRSQVNGLRESVTRLEALVLAKTRESFLLEQALLRVPLALGTGSSWWQKVKKNLKEQTTTPTTSP